MTNLLEVRNLWIEARGAGGQWQPIVKGISLDVAPGEVLALIGESGAGKSTIALASMGYARPGCRISGGEVLLNGQDVLKMGNEARRQIRGRDVAYIAQSAAAAFNAALKLGSQIVEAPLIHGLCDRRTAERQMVERARRLRLPEPEAIGQRYPHEVSGGQLQRLMAVMAMSCSPKLLVLDEPTTAIDVTTQVEVLAAFKDAIADAGASAIYVTHDLAVVAQIATKIIVLRHGEMIEEGTTEQILHRPQVAYTRQLMNAVKPPPKRLSPLEQADSGKVRTTVETPALSIEHVGAGYGGRRGRPATPVLFDISLQVPKQSAVAIIGESGCGKSTLARVLSGLTPAHEGRLLLDGVPLDPDVGRRSMEQRRRIQLVLQMPDVAFNPRRTVGHAIERQLSFYFSMPAADRARRLAELLEMVELPADMAARFPHELSGGQKQRVNLARALAAQPDVLLCDEVTSALDAVVGAAVVELLRRLKDELALSIVFISHDLATVSALCDRVAVLYAGRVAEHGTLEELLAPPSHPYSRLLLDSVPEMRQGWLEGYRGTEEALQSTRAGVELGRAGCAFFPRCSRRIAGVCDTGSVPIREARPMHVIACHRTLQELASA